MGQLKIIGILIIGIIIGYTLPLLSNGNQNPPNIKTHYIEAELTNEKQNNLALTKTEKSTKTEVTPCHQGDNKLSLDELNTANEVTSLKKINSDLKSKYKYIEQELLKSQQKVKTLDRQVGELDESDITDKEFLELVPEDYENLVINFRGKMRDDIYDFHNQPEDLDVGFALSHNISSFIVSHAHSFGVELNSVTCKGASCEVLIKETELPSWDRIYNDMTKQDWWKFTSTNASSTTDAEGNIFIYNFMSI